MNAGSAPARVAALDWDRIAAEIDARGWARTGPLLRPAECGVLITLYDRDAPFRRRVDMARHGYGQGEYRYFAYPLPPLVAALRESLYAQLAPIANRWAALLGRTPGYPDLLPDFLARCHATGQMRPTPLLLKYGAGDYNCLHRDLYGELAFPLQATILLSDPDGDFTGGAFVLVSQRPRMQSRAEVVPLRQGEAVLFAVNQRPARGTRGIHRVAMRHGVTTVESGERYTAGIIFHDAA